MRRTKRVIFWVELIVIWGSLLVLGSKGADASDKRKTVRVGYFAFDGYHNQDSEGKKSGYGYELLQHLSGYTNWKLEYVGYDKSWSEMQSMLESGEIDLLTSAQRTPERMEKFDFSEDSIGVSSAILTVSANSYRYLVKDYKNWDGMRIGVLKDSSRNENLRQFAQEQGFSYTLVPFDDSEQMVEALRKEDGVDAILTSNLRKLSGERVLAQFDASPFYAMVKKGNTELLIELNEAIEQMDMTEIELHSQLMEKYYSRKNSDELSLSAEEREFVNDSQKKAYVAIINPERPPFSYWEDGDFKGILYDLAREIVEKSRLNIQILEIHTYEEYRKLIESGSYDIRLDAACTYEMAENLGYRKTVPYLSLSISRLYLRNGGGKNSVALLSESDLGEKYQEYLIDEYTNIVYYDTVEEIVEAVKSGKQGMAYLYRRSAELAVHEDVTNRLMVEDIFGYENACSLTVKASQSKYLFSILNKTVSSISEQDIKEAEYPYLDFGQKKFTFVGYVYANPFVIVMLVCAVFVLITLIAGLAYSIRKRRRGQIMLVEQERRNTLLADALATAESADAAKSQFLSRVSHEMRTPLNAIIGFLDLSKDCSMDKMKNYLYNCDIAAKQLLAVINDVLDMSSIEAGKMKLASEPFHFKEMIHSLTDMYLMLCQQKKIEFDTRILTPIDEWLIGDAFRVNQILMNLLNNAVKFTKEGHIWLQLSQREAGKNEVYVRVEVSDTGCGMSKQMQERLFRPFEQEDAETAQRYGGSGLGLSIVKSLVTMMGGVVSAESEQGKGTSFYIELPFEKSGVVQKETSIESIGELHVLCVDDEEKEREYLAAVLERMRVRYTLVDSGDNALIELMHAERDEDAYNVCLVDWRMPNMNGVETTQKIRERYGKDVIVIVVSAYEQHQVGYNAQDIGADLFIPKPLFQSTLYDLFMTLTNGELAKEESLATESKCLVGLRILLAEDNALNRMVAEGIIERFGMQCVSATNGKEVCEMFETSEPGTYQVILMDIQMPELNGYDAARKIREMSHPDAKTIPIIALTANAFKEDVAKALSYGMDAHVAKPIDPDVLASVLERCCL